MSVSKRATDRPGFTWAGFVRRWLAWPLAILAVMVIAAVIASLLSSGAKTRTVTAPSAATASSDTLQGAVVAAAAVAVRDLTDQRGGTLGYRVASFTSGAATLETITRVKQSAAWVWEQEGASPVWRHRDARTVWIPWYIHVAYQGGQWVKGAPTEGVGDANGGAGLWTSPPAILQELKPWPPA